MQKRKILVTGSNGVIGSYIQSIFSKDTLFLTTKQTLDITNKNNIKQKFRRLKPDVVIHLAAKTNIEECETNEKDAYDINTIGTKNIAEAAKEINSIVIYVSTAAVFNGKKKFYTEQDKPHPISIYGKTKLLGEQIVRKENSNSIIVRAGWVIGGGKNEKKFISYILQQAREGKKMIKVVNDKFGTLTYAKELIEYIKFLLDNNYCGIYHFGSSGTCSRFELAKHLVKKLNMDISIEPMPSSEFVNKFFAPRPKYEVIKSIKLNPLYNQTWKESLTKYIIDELYV